MAAMTLIGTLCIRTDANSKIGIGHLMRCLALAQAWRERGGNVILVSAHLSPPLLDRLNSEGVLPHVMESQPGSSDDAMTTTRVALKYNAEWLVLDGYHFSSEFRKVLKQGQSRLLVIDDLGDTDMSDADVVLNQNVYAEQTLYARCASNCRRLLGSTYTLLRREFWATPPTARSFPTVARRVLITFGGSDPDNFTQRVAVALQGIQETRLHLMFIVGAGNPHLASLHALMHELRKTHDVELLVNPPNLAEIMRSADVAISAAGATSWELAYLGVPSMLIAIAHNQEGIARRMHELGAAISLSSTSDPFNSVAVSHIRELLGSSQKRQRLSETACRLIDGRGAWRVAEALAAYPLQLRRATADDAHLLWEWANDPSTRQASYRSNHIPWEEHLSWFQRRMASPDICAFYIATTGSGQSVGTVRFDRDGDVAEMSLTLAPQARGKGWGAKLIRLSGFQVVDERFCREVFGHVKASNTASLMAFRRAGFRECGSSLHCGVESVEFRFPVQ